MELKEIYKILEWELQSQERLNNEYSDKIKWCKGEERENYVKLQIEASASMKAYAHSVGLLLAYSVKNKIDLK